MENENNYHCPAPGAVNSKNRSVVPLRILLELHKLIN